MLHYYFYLVETSCC